MGYTVVMKGCTDVMKSMVWVHGCDEGMNSCNEEYGMGYTVVMKGWTVVMKSVICFSSVFSQNTCRNSCARVCKRCQHRFCLKQLQKWLCVEMSLTFST